MQVADKMVKTASKGYDYNYASLADIAKAGHEIPKMRIKPTPDGDYIEYLDNSGEHPEWHIGAKIVIPQMAKRNDAQMYGAAVTYARRVTAQLALQLVCSDDDKVETQTKEDADANEKRNASRMSFDDIRKKLSELNTITEVNAFAKDVAKEYPNPTEKMRYVINNLFATRREELTVKRP